VRSLVIEDEPQIGAYVSRLLGQLHGIVDVVGSIADARQALDNFKYDLAIIDRMLPDGDALQVVTALSRSADRPAIIMLTSKDAKEDVVDGLDQARAVVRGEPGGQAAVLRRGGKPEADAYADHVEPEPVDVPATARTRGVIEAKPMTAPMKVECVSSRSTSTYRLVE